MSKEVYVTKAILPDFDEYVNEIRNIWDTHILTNMAEKHNELERKLAEHLGVSCVSLFCNGHMALELVIQALGLTGEVITTPFTFASTTHAIVRNGLKPIFCDIDPVNYTIDASRIEGLITDKTSAIIPVHVYGNVCDVEEIDRIAKKYDLKVIYDAAHAFGVKYKGKGVGSFGDASMFSFHATKVFNTIEGGAVTYSDSNIGKALYELKNFGIKSEEEVEAIGANAKMNEFAAAMGLCNLRHFDKEISERKRVSAVYDSRLKDIPGLITPIQQEGVVANHAYYPLRVEEEICGISRDRLFDEMALSGINARKYFYPLISDFGCYRSSYDSEKTPVAKKVADQILTLPMYGDLEDDTVDGICDVICNCIRK